MDPLYVLLLLLAISILFWDTVSEYLQKVREGHATWKLNQDTMMGVCATQERVKR